MSYAIHPYAVSVAAIKKCVGSRDARILKKLNRKFRRQFGEIDELDDEAVPTERALAQLVMGEELDKDSSFKYGYALKLLCEHLGEMLTNEHWSALGWDWIEEVDEALGQLEIDKTVFRVDPHLTTRGAPIPLPQIDDFPAIGYLVEEELANVAVELAGLREGDFDKDEILESIGEVRQWLDRCTRSHKDLVCFCH